MPSRLPNRHSADALPPGSSAGIEGSDGDNNAKVTHSTRLSKFRDKFYRQNIDNHRPGDAAPGKEVLLPARRVAESDFRRHETRKDGAPTPRNSGVPGVPEGRNATFRDRSTPEPQDTEVSEHRNREAREPQDTKATRYRNRKTQRSRGSGTARLKGLGAQGASRRRTLSAHLPPSAGLRLAVGAAARAVGRAAEELVDILGRRDAAPVRALQLVDDVLFAEDRRVRVGTVLVGPLQ